MIHAESLSPMLLSGHESSFCIAVTLVYRPLSSGKMHWEAGNECLHIVILFIVLLYVWDHRLVTFWNTHNAEWNICLVQKCSHCWCALYFCVGVGRCLQGCIVAADSLLIIHFLTSPFLIDFNVGRCWQPQWLQLFSFFMRTSLIAAELSAVLNKKCIP